MPDADAISHAQSTRSSLVGTESAAHGILRVRYSHDAMIDLMLAEPSIKQYQLAKHFNVTGPWVSRVLNSDAFLARLAQRKAEVIDPLIVHNMEEKLLGLMDQSVEILSDKLDASKSPDLAARALELTTKALGYGAKRENLTLQQTFVVALPKKEESAGDWASKYGPGVSEAVVVERAKVVSPDQNPESDLMRLAGAASA